MNYEIAFYAVVSFVVGFIAAKFTPIYIGDDKEKYEKAGAGILLKK